MNILVLGIGQSMRGDDAAGLEVVRLWQKSHPQTASRVRVETSEIPGVGLLDLLQGADVAVIVDAVKSDVPGETVIRLESNDLASFGLEEGFTHGWGVAETLRLMDSLYPESANRRVILIGIVGSNFDLANGPSTRVKKAFPKAVEMIESEVRGWL